jgi:hypothetical protein
LTGDDQAEYGAPGRWKSARPGVGNLFAHVAQQRWFREYIGAAVSAWKQNCTLTFLDGAEPVTVEAADVAAAAVLLVRIGTQMSTAPNSDPFAAEFDPGVPPMAFGGGCRQ